MAFFPEIKRLPLSEVMNGFAEPNCLKGVPKSEKLFWLQEAALRLARSGSAGLAFLIHQLRNADEERLRAVLFGLSTVDGRVTKKQLDELRELLIRYLEDSRPLVVAEAVDSLNGLACSSMIPRVKQLLHHASPYVVGSALRFLARQSPDEAPSVLQKALESAEPIVRQNAVDELDELAYVAALPKIRRLTNDPDKNVRQAALTAVANLEDIARDR